LALGIYDEVDDENDYIDDGIFASDPVFFYK
jgi:hypothetical protein